MHCECAMIPIFVVGQSEEWALGEKESGGGAGWTGRGSGGNRGWREEWGAGGGGKGEFWQSKVISISIFLCLN